MPTSSTNRKRNGALRPQVAAANWRNRCRAGRCDVLILSSLMQVEPSPGVPYRTAPQEAAQVFRLRSFDVFYRLVELQVAGRARFLLAAAKPVAAENLH